MDKELFQLTDWVIRNNHQFLAVNKPASLPVQPDKTGDISLLTLAERYCHQPLHLVHRLDRPASGLVILAKKPAVAAHLSSQWQDRQVEKWYLAMVAQPPPMVADTLTHYLVKDAQAQRSRVQETPENGAQEAVLRYLHIGQSDRYHLLAIQLLSGRFHQIRAQLGHIGCPIRGDVKYGFRRRNPDRSIDLHAWRLRFQHPVTDDWETLVAPPPSTPLWAAFTIPDELPSFPV